LYVRETPSSSIRRHPDDGVRRISSRSLAERRLKVIEDAGVGVLGEEGGHPPLPPAPLGDVVLLDQGVVAVIRDGVEIQVEGQVEGAAAFEPESAHGVEPAAHQLRVASRIDAAAVLGQEGSLGDDVQPGEEGQPLVEHGAHDVGMTGGAEELQGQQRAQCAARRDHARAGQPDLPGDRVERDCGRGRQEQEQPAEAGPQVPGGQVELPDVGDVGRGGPGTEGPFVVTAAGQSGEPLILEDLGDGARAEGMSFVVQDAADVVDREVLLAEGDDPVAEGVGLGRGLRSPGRGDEEDAVRVAAEMVDEDAEASGRVAGASRRLGPREALDEVGPEGLVLPVGGVGRHSEDAGEVR
jgi:hypothetical protein